MMQAVGYAFLLLIAIFSGGCSLAFSPLFIGAGDPGFSMLFSPFGLMWLSGFVICGFCIRGLISSGQSPQSRNTPSESDLSDHFIKPDHEEGSDEDARLR